MQRSTGTAPNFAEIERHYWLQNLPGAAAWAVLAQSAPYPETPTDQDVEDWKAYYGKTDQDWREAIRKALSVPEAVG